MTEPVLHSPGLCPTCNARLRTSTRESISVEACGAGHGVFLTADALTAALRDRTNDRSAAEEESAVSQQSAASAEALEASHAPRACPACATPMQVRIFAYESGVPIDVCSEHGTWLDEHELERIEAWYEAQEGHRAVDRKTWGGAAGKLEQIEEQHERQAAEDEGSVHWGPFRSMVTRLSWANARRDD